MFKHPSYYKKLRERNKSDRVISSDNAPNMDRTRDGECERAPGLGLQVTSHKLPGPRPISNANKGLIHKRQASSTKQQAIEETVPHNDIEEAQASSSKRLEPQAASVKPRG